MISPAILVWFAQKGLRLMIGIGWQFFAFFFFYFFFLTFLFVNYLFFFTVVVNIFFFFIVNTFFQSLWCLFRIFDGSLLGGLLFSQVFFYNFKCWWVPFGWLRLFLLAWRSSFSVLFHFGGLNRDGKVGSCNNLVDLCKNLLKRLQRFMRESNGYLFHLFI